MINLFFILIFLLLLGKNIHYMNKKQAIFNENDIPYKELELIGISKNRYGLWIRQISQLYYLEREPVY